MQRTLLAALLALASSAVAAPALAGPMADTATCTEWVLNNFEYTDRDGVKHRGITEEKAKGLHVGTRYQLPNGSWKTLEPAGASFWRGCETYVVKGGTVDASITARPIAQDPPAPQAAPATPPKPAAKPEQMKTAPAPKPIPEKKLADAAPAASDADISFAAKRAAEDAAAAMAEEAESAAQTALIFASTAKSAARTAVETSSVGQTRTMAAEAKEAAESAEAKATVAVRTADEALAQALIAGTPAAQQIAQRAEASKAEALAAAKSAKADSDAAQAELRTIVMDWPPTIALIALSGLVLLWLLLALFARMSPRWFNALFKGLLLSKFMPVQIPVAILLYPPLMLLYHFSYNFFLDHYGYLCGEQAMSKPVMVYEREELGGNANPGPGRDDYWSGQPRPYTPPRVRAPSVNPRREIPVRAGARR